MTTVEINGLKDMIACNTRISSIIDDHLSYSGYDISEFMENKASFEEVIYLLWNGASVDSDELTVTEILHQIGVPAHIKGYQFRTPFYAGKRGTECLYIITRNANYRKTS